MEVMYGDGEGYVQGIWAYKTDMDEICYQV